MVDFYLHKKPSGLEKKQADLEGQTDNFVNHGDHLSE